MLPHKLKMKLRNFTETCFFESGIHAGRELGEFLERDLEMLVVLEPQPAYALADIEKVVLPVGHAAEVRLQANERRGLASLVCARAKRVVHIVVVRVDSDLDAVEGNEGIRSHSKSSLPYPDFMPTELVPPAQAS